jgi:transposase
MAKGTKSEDVALILAKIPQEERNKVKEVTVDLADSMERIVRLAFPNATIINDRFHVQQLVSEGVQEVRIVFRKEAIREENEKIKQARENKERYYPFVYENGDTKKQLLARSRYLLFKPKSKWNDHQLERSKILFKEFPEIKSVYDLSMMFRSCYENSRTRQEAKNSLDKWYKKVAEKKNDSLAVAAESIRLHEETILNYFPDRSTNAAAESFNAKLKNFRTVVRGVVDKKFHLFRVAKLYA